MKIQPPYPLGITAAWTAGSELPDIKCHFHPGRIAVGTDAVVDTSHGGPHEVFYKRVAICWSCAYERSKENTSRVKYFKEPGALQL